MSAARRQGQCLGWASPRCIAALFEQADQPGQTRRSFGHFSHRNPATPCTPKNNALSMKVDLQLAHRRQEKPGWDSEAAKVDSADPSGIIA
ncbi:MULTISPECIES: hypothetical protein [unclassified Mesorhizobium]|uniref:hypothetical protein n=1 Tax=unclassified Mesorhizobium TaxID=325217 RepID=UPI0012EBF93F|nr:hypothetical protein [Mesorhizobium sp. LNJC384A00]